MVLKKFRARAIESLLDRAGATSVAADGILKPHSCRVWPQQPSAATSRGKVLLMSEGTVSLLWPPDRRRRPWRQFWRQHREFLNEAHSLLIEGTRVDDFCRRLDLYVSTDLFWVTCDGASPLLFEAFAEGLRHYRSRRADEFARRPFVTTLNAHREFVETTMSHVTERLSLVSLAGADAIWSAASGQPLRPWLEQQTGTISVRCRTFEATHAERVREALCDFVLDPRFREFIGTDHHS